MTTSQSRGCFATEHERRLSEQRERADRVRAKVDERLNALGKLLDIEAPTVLVKHEAWLLMRAATEGHPVRWLLTGWYHRAIEGLRWFLKDTRSHLLRGQSLAEQMGAELDLIDIDSPSADHNPPHAGSSPASPSELKLGGWVETKAIQSPVFTVVTEWRHRELANKRH